MTATPLDIGLGGTSFVETHAPQGRASSPFAASTSTTRTYPTPSVADPRRCWRTLSAPEKGRRMVFFIAIPTSGPRSSGRPHVGIVAAVDTTHPVEPCGCNTLRRLRWRASARRTGRRSHLRRAHPPRSCVPVVLSRSPGGQATRPAARPRSVTGIVWRDLDAKGASDDHYASRWARIPDRG